MSYYLNEDVSAARGHVSVGVKFYFVYLNVKVLDHLEDHVVVIAYAVVEEGGVIV